ncbi:MAG: YifB family Mg chelatase-like AAA ATPase [Candidatus Omnitrophica bacterium]|nr:YifB family Mg chelatase-like AAA ATPase [Candidatus Omnitrophota bacterium]
MLAKVFSFGLLGLDAYPITIEVDVGKGLPAMSIVGLPDSAVRESKERVRAAIRNSGHTFPSARITVNLAPADIKKEGPSFDLAIALGILSATEQVPEGALRQYAVLGELSLSGQIKPVTGILSATLAMKDEPFAGILVPASNTHEAALAGTTPVFGFRHLNDIVRFLNDPTAYQAVTDNRPASQPKTGSDVDFSDVKGQIHAKRGLEIAAAGNHNALLIGPPGSGKTMLARRFPTILPNMTQDEALTVTKIHSAAGYLKSTPTLLLERPFRTPHHSASNIALVGGGADPRPGEVTLAHNGVLFLDELPEFQRSVIEGLRQPLEDGEVTIARASKTLRFPARFALLTAMNPCLCGHLNDRQKPCRCSPAAVHKYMAKISGPLLDRIDIHLHVPALQTAELFSAPAGEGSEAIRARVMNARARQTARFGKAAITANAQMTQQHLRAHCALNAACRSMLKDAVEALGLSARGHDKVLKVARTISDLTECEEIKPEHLAEAIGYRCLDKINN